MPRSKQGRYRKGVRWDGEGGVVDVVVGLSHSPTPCRLPGRMCQRWCRHDAADTHINSGVQRMAFYTTWPLAIGSKGVVGIRDHCSRRELVIEAFRWGRTDPQPHHPAPAFPAPAYTPASQLPQKPCQRRHHAPTFASGKAARSKRRSHIPRDHSAPRLERGRPGEYLGRQRLRARRTAPLAQHVRDLKQSSACGAPDNTHDLNLCPAGELLPGFRAIIPESSERCHQPRLEFARRRRRQLAHRGAHRFGLVQPIDAGRVRWARDSRPPSRPLVSCRVQLPRSRHPRRRLHGLRTELPHPLRLLCASPSPCPAFALPPAFPMPNTVPLAPCRRLHSLARIYPPTALRRASSGATVCRPSSDAQSVTAEAKTGCLAMSGNVFG